MVKGKVVAQNRNPPPEPAGQGLRIRQEETMPAGVDISESLVQSDGGPLWSDHRRKTVRKIAGEKPFINRGVFWVAWKRPTPFKAELSLLVLNSDTRRNVCTKESNSLGYH